MSPTALTTDHIDGSVFADYLVRTRWFGGKGRDFDVTGVRRIGVVPGAEATAPVVLLHLVDVTYADAAPGEAPETYQVPLVFYAEPESRLDHAFVGWWEEPVDSPIPGWVHAYDALHDRDAMACWLSGFATAGSAPGGNLTDADSTLAFHRVPGYELDPTAPATLFSGEQSNSSVFFGEDSVLKIFRKITAGVNPDVQVHEVLTRAGSENIAALYGWLDVLDRESEGVLQLAMLQQFLRTASDGWELALGSVRDLFRQSFTQPLDLSAIAEAAQSGDSGEIHARDAGGDFAAEAARLGESVRTVHRLLAEHFPTETMPTSRLAQAMRSRLDDAIAIVPALGDHGDRLREVYAAVADLGEIATQRVHGDLHLGQTLRTSLGWKLVDFEGEPAKILASRLQPDSRWRDVAGMLRSFDYAPRVVERDLAAERVEGADQRAVQADEWAHRNRNHFLAAYCDDAISASERLLLAAYVADKAVYEVIYETRNRPAWVDIPLRALAEIGV